MDELFEVLTQQLQETKVTLLSQQRLAAYKFFNSAYNHTDNREDLEFDAWEFKLLFAMNHAVGLPCTADRDEMRREIAYARSVMEIRYANNPRSTDIEQRIFEMVESFNMVGELA